MKDFALAILAFTTPLAFAQPPQPAPPTSIPTCASPALVAFDVASVKPSQTAPGSIHAHGTADTLSVSASLFNLIESAYDLHDFQIVGGPDWIKTSTWDVVAKVDQPTPDYLNLPSDARGAIQRRRMQAVLAQRFAFKCHFETRELPVYNVVLAKGGIKMHPTPADAPQKGSIDGEGRNRQHHVEGKGVDLSEITGLLTYNLGRTVIDKTGLTGLYDFTLTYTSDPDADSSASGSDIEPSAPTIFAALEEQLGLRLEPAKGPVPVLVIDSIDRPSGN